MTTLEEFQQIEQNIINTLAKLDHEYYECKDNYNKNIKIEAIKRLLKKVKMDYGPDEIIFCVMEVNKKIGHNITLHQNGGIDAVKAFQQILYN
jgi:hypothetical protein